MDKKGQELWDFIEEKAQIQEGVDDNWKVTMIDLGHPFNIGWAKYRLKNVVTGKELEGTLENHMKEE